MIKKFIAGSILALAASSVFANFVFIPAFSDASLANSLREAATRTHYVPIVKIMGKDTGVIMTAFIAHNDDICTFSITSNVGSKGPAGSVNISDKFFPSALTYASFRAPTVEMCAQGFYMGLENNAEYLIKQLMAPVV